MTQPSMTAYVKRLPTEQRVARVSKLRQEANNAQIMVEIHPPFTGTLVFGSSS